MGCGASKQPEVPAIDVQKQEQEQRRKIEEAEKAREEAAIAELKAKQELEEKEKEKERQEIERLKQEEEAAEALRKEQELLAAEAARREQEEREERQRAAEEEEARQLAAAAAEAERARAERCRVCCIVGPPGSIKGRLCELITQRAPALRHTSTGEALREAIKANSAAGRKARAERESGSQVSEETTLELMLELLRGDQGARWLLDGYPRTAAQAAGLKGQGLVLGKLLSVQIDDDELVRRAVGRRIDPVEHTLYHLEGLGFPAPPDDPEVHARLTQRKDDTEDRVRARLKQYYEGGADLSADFVQALRVDGTREPADADDPLIDEILGFLDA